MLQACLNGNITCPILLHGNGNNVWHMIALARDNKHDTRAGLEDGLTLPDQSNASCNADLLQAGYRIFCA